MKEGCESRAVLYPTIGKLNGRKERRREEEMATKRGSQKRNEREGRKERRMDRKQQMKTADITEKTRQKNRRKWKPGRTIIVGLRLRVNKWTTKKIPKKTTHTHALCGRLAAYSDVIRDILGLQWEHDSCKNDEGECECEHARCLTVTTTVTGQVLTDDRSQSKKSIPTTSI